MYFVALFIANLIVSQDLTIPRYPHHVLTWLLVWAYDVAKVSCTYNVLSANSHAVDDVSTLIVALFLFG